MAERLREVSIFRFSASASEGEISWIMAYKCGLHGELTSCGSKQASRKVETKSFIVRPRENSRKVPTNPMKATVQLRIVKGGYDFTFDWICCRPHDP